MTSLTTSGRTIDCNLGRHGSCHDRTWTSQEDCDCRCHLDRFCRDCARLLAVPGKFHRCRRCADRYHTTVYMKTTQARIESLLDEPYVEQAKVLHLMIEKVLA